MALILVTVLAAPAFAYHISVGATDSVGVAAAESAANPSVPAASALFRIGTGAQPCTRLSPSGDGLGNQPGAAAADTTAALAAHPYCQRLVYNLGTAQQAVSQPDQHYPLNAAGSTWRFDAVMTGYVGTYYMDQCHPYCQNPAWEAIVNTVLKAAGLWTDPATPPGGTCQKEIPPGEVVCGWQEYSVNLALPSAALAAQSALAAAGVAVADGNGWSLPVGDQTFLGFLTHNAIPVTQADLTAHVAAYKAAGQLGADAADRVCGFLPEPGVDTSSDDSGDLGWCEVAFAYRAEHPGTWDYRDPCTSTTYFCGSVGGGAWYAYELCQVGCTMQARNADLVKNRVGGAALTPDRDGYDSTVQYETWHFVVAPTLSACRGHAEPGFVTAAAGAAQPYIAHDLDVYAPAGSRQTTTGAWNADPLVTYYAGQAERQAGVAPQPLRGETTGVQVDTGTSAGSEASDTAGTPLLRKQHNLEPNSLGDTSGTLTAARAAAHPCASVVNAGLQRDGQPPLVETHLDPWVNIVDSRVRRSQLFDADPVFGEIPIGDIQNPYDLYASTSATHDRSNRPAPTLEFEGRVGFFADADDDLVRADAEAEYEPVVHDVPVSAEPWETRFENDPFWIGTTGAYPVYWDTWFNLSNPPGAAGPADKHQCSPGYTAVAGTKLNAVMAAAGYDVTRTGLVQVFYSPLPVVGLVQPVFIAAGAPQTVPPVLFTPGTAVVFLNQGLHELRLHGNAADQAFVASVVATAVAKLPAAPTLTVYARDVITFGPNDLGRWSTYQSDFGNQCDASTGAFANRWLMIRPCDGLKVACRGDTLVTAYTFRLNQALGSAEVPAPPVSLPVGTQLTWFDVDPVDNDAARNTA